jgi:CheY-like chemotaxis protein
VKRLVEMHDGHVEARSEGEGRGSEFIIRLPVVLSVTREETKQTDASFARPTSGHRVLIVDDNLDAATSLAMMLKLMNHEVRTAGDGAEGLDTAEFFRPILILLDLGMPRLNGYETCRRIREQPWGKEMVIFALTGWGQEEDKLRCQQAGFDGHFVKPVEPAAIEKLLARPAADLRSGHVR